MSVNRKQIARLTEQHGGEWAIQHAARLIRLVELIGKGLDYNPEVIWIAAHLHDWGTLPGFCRPGVPHSRLSCELAGEYLTSRKCPKPLMDAVLEAIEFHHGGAGDRSIETVLLADADALDGIGVLGVLREFAMIPTTDADEYPLPGGNGMSGARARAEILLENNPGKLHLPRSRSLARRRVKEMRALFTALDRDSFGCL